MQWIAPSRTDDAVWDVYASPLGPLTLEATGRGLRSISFPRRNPRLEEARRSPVTLAPVVHQLEEYFAGERTSFDLRLDIAASARDPLTLRVWNELRRIPYGETTTYGALGEAIGHADPREIGARVGRTPAPIVIPCHRVIGADGSLRGYGGGLHRKKALLLLERSGVSEPEPLPAWAHEQLDLLKAS
jgi:methylated-DNA-[protein]-cysteine S-methyltransferase